jgi:hypothetical protein
LDDADDSELCETVALTVLALRDGLKAKPLREEHLLVQRVWEMAGACSNGGIRALAETTIRYDELLKSLQEIGAEESVRGLKAAAPLLQRKYEERSDYYEGLSDQEQKALESGEAALYDDGILAPLSDYIRSRRDIYLELPNVGIPRYYRPGRGTPAPREGSSTHQVARWILGMWGYVMFHEIRYPHGGYELFTDSEKLPWRWRSLTLAGFTLPRKRRDADENLKILAHWKGRSSVESIELEGNRIGDQGLMALQAFPKLNELGLGRSTVRDNSLGLLAALPKLRSLDLSQTAIGVAGLTALARHPSLSSLDLSGVKVTLSMARVLAEIPNLAELDCDIDELEPAAMQLLKKSRPGLKLG